MPSYSSEILDSPNTGLIRTYRCVKGRTITKVMGGGGGGGGEGWEKYSCKAKCPKK